MIVENEIAYPEDGVKGVYLNSLTLPWWHQKGNGGII